MNFFDDKYFSYIASSYSITFIVLLGLVAWVTFQHRAYNSKLSALEKQGITRRSGKSAKA